MKTEDRVGYLDRLRATSVLGVVILHVSAQNWSVAGVYSPAWHLFNAVDSLLRWATPMFVMISGALMLSKDHAPRDLFRKTVRLAAAFLFWSVLYAAVESAYRDLGPGEFLGQVAAGHSHMWFIIMIAGLYLLVPFLKRLVESRRLTEYFLLLALIFNFALPQLISALSLASPGLSGAVSAIVNKGYLHFPLGFTGYFVLGHYLYNTDIPKKTRRLLYVLSLCGFAATAGFTAALSQAQGRANDMLYTLFSLNVFLECPGVFVFFKYRGGKAGRAAAVLSKCSFGVYLVHLMVLEFLANVLGLNTLSFTPLLSVPVISLIVCAVSCGISCALGRIPKLGRYIV